MPALPLTQAEVVWLVDMVGPLAELPQNYAPVLLGRRTDDPCGPMFRLKLVAGLRQAMRSNPGKDIWDWTGPSTSLEVSLEELWLLEALLAQYPVRRIALADGGFLVSLSIKVWDLLLDEYKDDIPENLRSSPADYSAGALDEVARLLRSTANHDSEDEHD